MSKNRVLTLGEVFALEEGASESRSPRRAGEGGCGMKPVRAYPAIASAFSRAIAEPDRPDTLSGAIAAMKQCPDTCAKIRCFNNTVWEIVADTLNSKVPIKDTEAFEHACALLESMDKEAPHE